MTKKGSFKLRSKLDIDSSPKMGEEYVDLITGFVGVVVSKTRYLDGTTASCLQSKGSENNYGQSVTIDDKRLIAKRDNDVY